VAIVLGLSCWTARGADEPAKTETAEKAAEASKAPSAEQIAKLVEQLDADRYADRQAASEKLATIGKPAIAALFKAAVGESAEVTVRAIGLLGKFLESSDQETKNAAKSALETIAKSDRQGAARRAQELIKPPAMGTPAPGGNGIALGRIQFQVQAIGVGVGGSRKSMKVVNGVKEIEAEEDGKTVKITDDPQQGIKIEVTSKENGKDVTKKYEAKDAKELEKKHPEGYKLYKEHAADQNVGGGGGVLQLQFNAGGIQIAPAVPAPMAPLQPGNREAPRRGIKAVESATATMETLSRLIETLTKDARLKDASKESKEALKKQIGEIQRRLSDLEKQLDAK
jgi:hypothetical protein